MLIVLKSVLRSLILPPSGLLLLAFLGLFLGRRYRRLGTSLLVFGLVSLWLCCTPVVADALQRLAERYPPLDLARPVDAQAIVILGGGTVRIAPEYGGPAASLDTLERVIYGAYVARRTSLPVLVTGAPLEAAAMQATLSRDLGMRARWVEGHSRDTFQNAQFSAPLLRADGIHRIILVTNSTHEWRAAHEFMSAGFEVVPAPVGTLPREKLELTKFVPGMEPLMRSNLAVYELIGDPVRRLFAALHLRRQQPSS